MDYSDEYAENRLDMQFDSYAMEHNDFEYPEIPEDPEYTRSDLLEVIGMFCKLNIDQFKLVQLRFRRPMASFSELGRELGISKQAVDKRIARICEGAPLWRDVLRIVPKRGGKSE